MKRIIVLTLVFICLLSLCGCNNNTADTTAEHEAVSADYGKVIDLAKEEFAEVFKEFENVQIEETTTMARTDDAKEIVVQFKYSSSNGNGLYGFLYETAGGEVYIYTDERDTLIQFSYTSEPNNENVYVNSVGAETIEVTVNGTPAEISVSPSEEETDGIVWTDPDTNTLFFISGHFDEDTLIQMAESVMKIG